MLKLINKNSDNLGEFEVKITRLFNSFRDSESGQTARMIKKLESRIDDMENNNGKR